MHTEVLESASGGHEVGMEFDMTTKLRPFSTAKSNSLSL